MISRDAGREGACAGAKASPGKLTLLFFSYPLSISYFLTFPGRKGAGRGGEEGIPLTGLRYFPFVWSGYDIFSCEASLFRTHACAHTLILTTLGEPSKDTSSSHILFYFIGTCNVRPAGNGSNHTFKMYLCTYKGQSKCWEGRDFTWLRWDLGPLEAPRT